MTAEARSSRGDLDEGEGALEDIVKGEGLCGASRLSAETFCY